MIGGTIPSECPQNCPYPWKGLSIGLVDQAHASHTLISQKQPLEIPWLLGLKYSSRKLQLCSDESALHSSPAPVEQKERRGRKSAVVLQCVCIFPLVRLQPIFDADCIVMFCASVLGYQHPFCAATFSCS